jgi:hypothetical protein
MGRLLTYPEPNRRVVPRKGTADNNPEVAGRTGTIVAVTGSDDHPDVHVVWDGLAGPPRIHARSYLLLETDPEPTFEQLRWLKGAGVLTDWYQHQQGEHRGYWNLSGPQVRARNVPWSYVEGFVAGGFAAALPT